MNNAEDKKIISAGSDTYTDDAIQVLKPLEAIRTRPGMYIGSTDSDGLHHLIWEILDNAVDEMQAGFADEIVLTLHKDHVITISDNGRGIPTGRNSSTGKSNLLVVFTSVHSGAKFDDKSTYKTSGGLHGVGSTCVNALSEFMHVRVCRDGKEFIVKFKDGGEVEQEPTEIGEVSADKHGTVVTWKPDFSIFDKAPYDHHLIEARLKSLAYLNEKKRFRLVDEVNGEDKLFCFENGIKDWVSDLNKELDERPREEDELVGVIGNMVSFKHSGQLEGRRDGNKRYKIDIECAFQYRIDGKSDIRSFCNNISTPEGGTHLEAFKDGLLLCVREKALEKKFIKRDKDIEKSDVSNALIAIVSLKYEDPQYAGQTKGRLTNIEIKKFISDEVRAVFWKFMEENPEFMNMILERIKDSRSLRLMVEETKKAERVITRKHFLNYADKLADCTLKDPELSELYIVEGDSAGGSAKSARNRDYQAILPVKGKLMNVWKNKSKFSNNKEIQSLISAIGCGYEYGNSKFDITKMRYKKIIIMTDADVDGSHIRTLVLTFIYKFMYSLIKEGRVYIAQPPLFKASTSKHTKYFKDEIEKEKFSKDHPGWDISRFKGLGEMSPDQLWETTMDPERRALIKVTVDMMKDVDDRWFEDLMGDKVKPRTQFIMDNYSTAQMIDV